MDNELHQHHPVIRRIYLYIFIVTFLLFFAFVVVYFSQVQAPTQPEDGATGQQTTETGAVKAEDKGYLTLALQNNDSNEVQVGQTFNLVVGAFSEDSDIVGFDVLISYDQDVFTTGKATTPLRAFQIFSKEHDDYQSFTGALTPEGEAVNFSSNDIMTVPLTAKQKGKYTFTILPSISNETTKLVESETTKVFAPEVTSLQITVN